VTTGVYEPEEDNEQVSNGVEDGDDNSNNNAYDQGKASAKYKVPPKPPSCGILVVLYGDRGKTSELPLLSSAPGGKSSFTPGCPDDFKVFKIVL